MIWLLVAADLGAGAYLLGWALRREQRDRDGVLAVGAILILCALLLGGLGAWQLTQEVPAPMRPGAPTVVV